MRPTRSGLSLKDKASIKMHSIILPHGGEKAPPRAERRQQSETSATKQTEQSAPGRSGGRGGQNMIPCTVDGGHGDGKVASDAKNLLILIRRIPTYQLPHRVGPARREDHA